MFEYKHRKRGFTLIELLVVVAIIGLLASVVLASLNGARAKSRNTKRIADLGQLINAFNLGLSNNLPTTGGGWACISGTCYDGWSVYSANATVDAFFTPYMSQKPVDPTGGSRGYGGYLYINTWAGGTAYNGVVFPPGAYIYVMLEPPLTSTSCGPAKVWDSISNRVACLYKLD